MEQTPQTIDAFTRLYQTLLSKPEYLGYGLFLIMFIVLMIFMLIDRRDKKTQQEDHKAFVGKVMDENAKREERLIGLIEGPIKEMTTALREVRQEVAEIKRGDLP